MRSFCFWLLIIIICKPPKYTKSHRYSNSDKQRIERNTLHKEALYIELANLLLDDVIVASNTSALNIFEIVPKNLLPQQLICHWYSPPQLIPLVEVVKSEEAPQEYLAIPLPYNERKDFCSMAPSLWHGRRCNSIRYWHNGCFERLGGRWNYGYGSRGRRRSLQHCYSYSKRRRFWRQCQLYSSYNILIYRTLPVRNSTTQKEPELSR